MASVNAAAPTETTLCVTCKIVGTYVDLASKFADRLGEVMFTPMFAIFLAIAGIWIVWNGIKFAFGKGDLIGLFQELIFISVAGALLGTQGREMMMLIYHTALATISGAASAVLAVAQEGFTVASGQTVAGLENYEGMTRLVFVAERGVTQVFGMAWALVGTMTLTNWSGLFLAIILLPPWFLLLVVYMAQVAVSIFRVMMWATLSPYLFMALGFGWGRDTVMRGINVLLASFMVLFGSTVALAVCLFGVSTLGVGDYTRDYTNLSLMDPEFLLPVFMGWLGTAFQMEATGMANSITGAQLTNQAAAIITGGASFTAIAAAKQAKGQWGEAAGKIPGGFATGAGWLFGAATNPSESAGRLSAGAQAVMDRIKNPMGKKD